MDDERIPMMAHLTMMSMLPMRYRRIARFDTPLNYAIRAQSLAKVKFLLEKGADPHKPVGLAGFPLKMAERMGLEEFVSLLKRHP